MKLRTTDSIKRGYIVMSPLCYVGDICKKNTAVDFKKYIFSPVFLIKIEWNSFCVITKIKNQLFI